VYSSHIQLHQAAKGVNTNYDELADLLNSINHLLKPLDIYARIPLTPTMDEMVVKIMVEILSALALTTKRLKQGRQSESFHLDFTLTRTSYINSMHRRKIRKEDF
jgi:hypothetical protein